VPSQRKTRVLRLAGRRERPAHQRPAGIPEVRLGKTTQTGVAPSMFALLERGVQLRPEVAMATRGRVVFRFAEPFAPLRVSFASRAITVEDGDLRKPDLAIEGSLPDIVNFVATPLVGGIPNPARVRGRAAIAQVARRRVRLVGDRSLARNVLRLLALDRPRRGE
jgi:hypothetical protein